MNSNDPDFDWHKRGVWIAHDPEGRPVPVGAGSTPHAARAAFTQSTSCSWAELRTLGYSIHEYVPATASPVTVKDEVAVNAETRWRYPANGEAAPAGATVQLLTRGRVSVRGVWTDSGDFIAWAPMIKRDKDLEARLGL